MRSHAAAPPGEWLNDPNALSFKDGRYRLYAQHATSSAAGERIGWGGLESDNLLDWRWTGRVIEPDAEGRSAYSGSIASHGSEHSIALTRHDHATGMQSQQWIGVAGGAFGPVGRDCRDPFILSAEPGNRAVLIARPCNWHDWRSGPPSHLEVWRESASEAWSLTGTIGPWSPPGVLWEVPQLLRLGDTDVLIVSTVDRRDDKVLCDVRYWFGRWSGDRFDPAVGWPSEGKLLDGGPDFYAAIVNLEDGWPDTGRTMIGWASSWAYARTIVLPNGGCGGPISLPRSIAISRCGARLEQRPLSGAAWCEYALAAGERIRLISGTAQLALAWNGEGLRTTALRNGLPGHDACLPMPSRDLLRLAIYRDGPLIEIFTEPFGLAITTLLPGLVDEGELALS
jgi:beta-fructofuranosidase